MDTCGRLQGTGGVSAFPAAGDGRWMQFSDAAGNGAVRRAGNPSSVHVRTMSR